MPGTGQSTPGDAGAGIPRLAGATAARRVKAGKVLWEAVLVAAAGAVFAFAANEVSPRGLKLNQDYFPGAARSSAAPAASLSRPTPRPGGTNVSVLSPADEALAARLETKGLRLVESTQVERLFRDPRYAQGLIVFVDARNDEHYQEGHIPGAHQFDHYRAAQYFAAVLPVCQAAEQVVVYCTGGNCEDSEFAAIFLRDAGIPAEKLLVYGGGMAEWTANGQPIEVGARKSGQLRNAGK